MKRLLLATLLIIASFGAAFSQSDAALRSVTDKDRVSRDAQGRLLTLAVTEHLLRADVYMANRHFPEAREHWQKIIDNFPTDQNAMPRALFGMGRSLMWERQYQKSIEWFDKLNRDFLSTKEGREGLAFKGACYVRLNKNLEAAKVYEQYAVMFPTGEKIESAFLNIIDAYREAGKYQDANAWVDKARQRFSGMGVETNAMQARVRMEIFRQNWNDAVRAADDLLLRNNFANSTTTVDEIRYLKGVALEKAGRRGEAIMAYGAIRQTVGSYYGGLAADKLRQLNATQAIQPTASVSSTATREFPVVFRDELLRSAKANKIDPRFLLAIMKQESSFRANAKSPAAARGLLQLVFDTAIKYKTKAGSPNLQPDDLYQPSVNIAIGTTYIAALRDQFGGLYEAIAASYNGGEDNAARWLNRTRPRDAGIFTAEIGFPESKNYVYKVMSNYRIYSQLYTEDLVRR